MSGTLTAKGRIYVDADTLRAIEARIPDGYDVQVQRTDAWWLLYLHVAGGGGRLVGPLRLSRGRALKDACLFALDHWAVKA